MSRLRPAPQDADELIQVVLDDASVERLRTAAAARGIEVEQLMVQLLHLASFRVDDVLRCAIAKAPEPLPRHA